MDYLMFQWETQIGDLDPTSQHDLTNTLNYLNSVCDDKIESTPFPEQS